jgi:hypothetical protein
MVPSSARLSRERTGYGHAGNTNGGTSGDGGGTYQYGGSLTIRNATVTGIACRSNYGEDFGFGSGIVAFAELEIAYSTVAGKLAFGDVGLAPSDITGRITLSNGHNIFSNVEGIVAGDRVGIDAGTLFGNDGRVDDNGIVPLKANVANPALGGADRFAIGAADQSGTARPTPRTRSMAVPAAISSRAGPATTSSTAAAASTSPTTATGTRRWWSTCAAAPPRTRTPPGAARRPTR